MAKMRNMGEACTAANRFHVHESLVDDFSRRLADRLGAMKVGRGTEPGVEVGPLIDAKQRRQGRRAGRRRRGQGGAPPRRRSAGHEDPGYFFEPTVLVDVPADARLLREEIFGPVAPVVSFSTDDEALDAANDTEFGLVAYAYTRSLDRALAGRRGAWRPGMVGVNQGLVSNAAAPFGGIKHSGFGREGGAEGIDAYLETQIRRNRALAY